MAASDAPEPLVVVAELEVVGVEVQGLVFREGDRLEAVGATGVVDGPDHDGAFGLGVIDQAHEALAIGV